MNRRQQAVVTAIEKIIEARGPAVLETEFTDGELSMDLQLASPNEDQLLEDLTTVAASYYGGLRTHGWDGGIDRLVAQLAPPDSPEEHQGERVQVTIQTEWARALDEDEISMEEYLHRIRSTTELVDPDGEVHDVEDVFQDGDGE
ncbi:hypothetical protein [Halorussus halobius]|uniref:hypothetical protein n=1 Tax=Halorussus halobius TaxID=1710537 RepID=UPI001091BD7C|nr:hypothetical protein [Halorussus halobius]